MYKKLLAVICCVIFLFVSGCDVAKNGSDVESNISTDYSAIDITELHVGENGNWWLGDKDTGIVVKEYVEAKVGENGNWWLGDKDTGIAVKQYLEPYVGTNGNWWYGFEDTGISVRPYEGENGDWWIGNYDTGISVKIIVEPAIGVNGNWWFGDTDTGIAVKPHIGTNGTWWLGDTDTGISVVTGTVGKVYETHNDTILQYLNDDYNNVPSFANGSRELYYPNEIELSCEAVAGASSYILYLSENEDLSDAWVFRSETNRMSVGNLKVRTKYYYLFKAFKGSNVYSYNKEVFRTDSNCPRTIKCEGVNNMRDLGGYLTNNGVVKQGMIYRCGRLNTSGSTNISREITDKGIETMRSLGIKSEIDLRLTSDNEVGGLTDKSVLGDDVNYYQCPMQYDDLYDNPTQVKAVFGILADESNYPLIFHCNIGTDRTGFVAYLINGLLGVKEEDLYRDYLLSNFSAIGGGRAISNMSSYINSIAAFAGSTLPEKIENYLLSIGVTKAQINSFKSIMYEQYNYYATVIEEATCEHGTVVYYDCVDHEGVSYTLTCPDKAPHNWEETGRSGDVIYFKCSYCGTTKEKDMSSAALELPEGYTKLEYIENTGTLYIDTGYKPNNTTHLIAEIEVPVSTSNVSYYYFGARGGGVYYTYSTYNGLIESKYGNNETKGADPISGKYVVERNGNNTILPTVTLTHTVAEFQVDYSMYIFAINNGGAYYSGSTGKLYGMTIYDNGNLVRYYIPCEYNGVVGLYDAVSERLFTDKSGAGFNAGPAAQ